MKPGAPIPVLGVGNLPGMISGRIQGMLSVMGISMKTAAPVAVVSVINTGIPLP
jgi:hypothetical protein